MDSRPISSPMIDHVVGVFSRENLSTVLASIHRAGFGPQTRVLDGGRSDVALQLERADLYVVEGCNPPGNAMLIVVTAPGRIAIVAELFERMGAEQILLASRGIVVAPNASPVNELAPELHIGSDSAAGVDA